MPARVNRLAKSKDCLIGRCKRSRLSGDKIYVGTPLGVAEFDRGRFSRVLGPGLLVTSLFVSGEDLLVGTEDQGVVRIPLTARRPGLSAQGSSAARRSTTVSRN